MVKGISFKNRLDKMQESIEKAVVLGKAMVKSETEKKSSTQSFSAKDYSKVQMHENGNIEHPYDVDCPYSHHVKRTDLVAKRSQIQTEQVMKDRIHKDQN